MLAHFPQRPLIPGWLASGGQRTKAGGSGILFLGDNRQCPQPVTVTAGIYRGMGVVCDGGGGHGGRRIKPLVVWWLAALASGGTSHPERPTSALLPQAGLSFGTHSGETHLPPILGQDFPSVSQAGDMENFAANTLPLVWPYFIWRDRRSSFLHTPHFPLSLSLYLLGLRAHTHHLLSPLTFCLPLSCLSVSAPHTSSSLLSPLWFHVSHTPPHFLLLWGGLSPHLSLPTSPSTSHLELLSWGLFLPLLFTGRLIPFIQW